MALAFTLNNMQDGYLDLIHVIMTNGRRTAPRGMVTRELPSPVIELLDPRRALVTGINRGFNTKLVAAEAVQLVGGFSDPAMLVRVAPNMAEFLDGGAFYGAYGPRVKSQLHEAVRQLTKDKNSRQAQITVWQTPDLFVKTRDKPCTSLLQFLIRDNALELHVTMRSNDIWWGVPYDIASFCILQCTVACWLNINVGSYFHRPVSLHAYERDFDKFDDLTEASVEARKVRTPYFNGSSHVWNSSKPIDEFIANEQARITDLAYARAEPLSEEEEWFVDKLT